MSKKGVLEVRGFGKQGESVMPVHLVCQWAHIKLGHTHTHTSRTDDKHSGVTLNLEQIRHLYIQ